MSHHTNKVQNYIIIIICMYIFIDMKENYYYFDLNLKKHNTYCI